MMVHGQYQNNLFVHIRTFSNGARHRRRLPTVGAGSSFPVFYDDGWDGFGPGCERRTG